ncbi:unnamed protein product [Absidia cylindrospora]
MLWLSQHLPIQCPQLTFLGINRGAFTNVTIVSVAQHCHRLRGLFLGRCDHVPPNLLTALVGACPLEVMDIDAKLIGSTRDNDTARRFVRNLLTFSDLKVLCLRQMDDVLSHHFLTLSIWPHLTKCYLQGCRDMEDQDAITFLKAHPHLTRLEFSANNFLDTVLYAIADSLPRLTFLDLSGGWDLTHHGVRRIVLKCTLLTNFTLEDTHLKRAEFPELDPHSDEYLEEFSDCPEMLTGLDDLSRTDMENIRRRHVPDQDNSNDANASDE